jgi:glycerol uptake facilitator-like aquaporin
MNDRNLLKGLFLLAVSLAFALGAWFRYPLGSFERPGPGFFPLMVGGFLGVLAIGMLVRSRFMEREKMSFNVNNIALILGSLVGFALLSQWINMIVGTTFLVFFATLAGTKYSLSRNAKVAAALVLIAFVFVKGLGLQLPLY